VAATGQERYMAQRIFGDRYGRSRELRWALVVGLLAIALLGAAALVVGALRRESIPPRPATNGWVAFQGNGTAGADLKGTGLGRGGHGDIYLARDGVPARRIIGSDGDQRHQMCPVFSPDGTRLAYVELEVRSVTPTPQPQPSGGSQPAVATQALEAPTQAADAPTDGTPRWRIVVVAMGGDGTPTDVVTEAQARPSLASCAEWSPDGQRLAYVASATTGQHELWVVTLDGHATPLGQPVRLFDDVTYASVAAGFAWSPDGSTIALADANQLWLLPVDTGAPRTLPVREIRTVSWSPDGTRLAISLGSDIRILTIDGQVVATVVRGEPDQAPPAFAWSPDGRWVAFMQGDDLVRVAPDGVRRETRKAGIGTLLNAQLPDEQPHPSLIGWSPDGQRVLVATGSPDVAGAILGIPAFTDGPGSVLVAPTLAVSAGSATWQAVRP
jgi:Tol biopolymer transport system component